MVYDQKIVKHWLKPTVLPLIQFMMNCEDTSSESGIVPLHAHVGNIDEIYHRLPSDTAIPLVQNLFVRTLADNLKAVRAASALFQKSLADSRSAETPQLTQNIFKPGDFVLKHQLPRPSKLYFEYLGPFLVLSQVKNDVQVRNLVYDSIHSFFVEDLKLFHGSAEQAMDAARRDTDQYAIEAVSAYRGDPLQRTTTSFLVQFVDGDNVWLPWSMDISSTQAFEIFCQSRNELYLLLYSAKEAKRIYAAINKQPISEVKPGNVAYVDLRWYGYDWYSGLGLPHYDTQRYVVAFEYTQWYHSTTRTKIVAVCRLFNEEWPLNHYFVRAYGSCLSLPENSTLVDNKLVVEYPRLRPAPKP
jgi:hypothetical protein